MSATSRGRRSDALYHATDMGRRVLCDKIALLEDELHESQEEMYGLHCAIAKEETSNAKLKADAERMFQANVEKNNEVLRLLGDNARLRECLQDFADLIRNDDGFGVDQGWMLDRIRELGIEVE